MNKKIIIIGMSIISIIVICIIIFYINKPKDGVDEFSKDYDKYKKQQETEEKRKLEGIKTVYIKKGMQVFGEDGGKLKYTIIEKQSDKVNAKKEYFRYYYSKCDMRFSKKNIDYKDSVPIKLKFEKLDIELNTRSNAIDNSFPLKVNEVDCKKFYTKYEDELINSLKVLGEVYYKKNDHKSDYNKFMTDEVYSDASKDQFSISEDFVDSDTIEPKLTQKDLSIYDEDHIMIDGIEFNGDGWDSICFENKNDKWIIANY